MSRSRLRTSVLSAMPTLVLCLPSVVHARPITLEQALAAADDSPALAAASAAVDEAAGALEQARTLRHNPSLSIAAGPAFGPGKTAYDLELGLSQVIELGGERGKRTRAAIAERDAARATVDATRAALRAEIWRTFHLVLVANERVRVTSDDEAAAKQLSAAATERLQLGAGTQTELNVARAVQGRAIAARKSAERDVLLARGELAAALGASESLEPTGSIPPLPATAADDAALIATALARRRDLSSLELRRQARDADAQVAAAVAVPAPELSVAWARSAVEHVDAVLVGVRLDLPLFNRNRGARSAARAASHRATIELEAGRRQVEREVRLAAARYRAALEAVAAFDRDVMTTLNDNLQLARESLAAGKLNLLELNTVRRDLVDSQLTYLDALAEAIEARAALEAAIGGPLEAP